VPQYRHRNVPSPRNLELQCLRIRARYPEFRCVRATPKQRVVVGPIQPTPISDSYSVQIRFGNGMIPAVNVLSPTLVPRPGATRLPHVYPGDKLCLYTFDNGDYNYSRDYIADTIIPWTAEWLAHYEIWFATGVWHGGGSQCLADKAPNSEELEQHADSQSND
jgi:hypothetical protein